MALPEGISWNEWSPEAFRRASAEGKLVFLDISAKWCHWCHVLDDTSLSDSRVIELLARSYVPVRVDTDRRPDINDRYNQGGWPSVAVLMPDGRLLTGATYLPPDELHTVLDRCAAFYAGERDRIDAWLKETGETGDPDAANAEAEPVEGGEEGPGAEALPLVKQAAMGQVDPVHLGFFGEPKFLMTDALAFLRDAWVYEPNAALGGTFLEIVRRMVQSEVFDPVEGGFFRYATKRDWTVPHYEKLLADNSAMLGLCASAYELSGDPLFSDAARGTLRFLLLTLLDRDRGAFGASQDADESYYMQDAEERSRRVPPEVDRTVISEYNAQVVSGLVVAARAFGEHASGPAADGLLPRAVRLGEYLFEGMRSDLLGQIRFTDGAGPHAGHLADNVASAVAYLDLHGATGDSVWLERAGITLDWTVGALLDGKRGLLDDRVGGGDDAGLLRLVRHPFQANAAAATALIRYGREAGREAPFVLGKTLLGRLSRIFDERMGPFTAAFGTALLWYLRGKPGKACIPGDPACEG